MMVILRLPVGQNYRLWGWQAVKALTEIEEYLRVPSPISFEAIVRVAYAYQKDRARHGSRAIAAQATARRERY